MNENGFYTFFLYEPTNKRYYRISKYLKDKSIINDGGDNLLNEMSTSIVVLDDNLDYVGEYEISDDRIGAYYSFIGKEGLYLALKSR